MPRILSVPFGRSKRCRLTEKSKKYKAVIGSLSPNKYQSNALSQRGKTTRDEEQGEGGGLPSRWALGGPDVNRSIVRARYRYRLEMRQLRDVRNIQREWGANDQWLPRSHAGLTTVRTVVTHARVTHARTHAYTRARGSTNNHASRWGCPSILGRARDLPRCFSSSHRARRGASSLATPADVSVAHGVRKKHPWTSDRTDARNQWATSGYHIARSAKTRAK